MWRAHAHFGFNIFLTELRQHHAIDAVTWLTWPVLASLLSTFYRLSYPCSFVRCAATQTLPLSRTHKNTIEWNAYTTTCLLIHAVWTPRAATPLEHHRARVHVCSCRVLPVVCVVWQCDVRMHVSLVYSHQLLPIAASASPACSPAPAIFRSKPTAPTSFLFIISLWVTFTATAYEFLSWMVRDSTPHFANAH